MSRSLLSLADVAAGELDVMVARAEDHGAAAGPRRDRTLAGRVVGSYFHHTSTRTRTAFSAAAVRLGAHVLTYGPQDLQLNTGESRADTARVLGSMLDALVIRHSAMPMDELRAWDAASDAAVVNAMCVEEHPTQAVADLATLRSRFGPVAGLHVLYLGEGNNTAVALAYACALAGVHLTLCTPEGYGVPESAMRLARARAAGCTVAQHHTLDALPDAVAAVYTTRWETTGTTKADPDWRHRFAPFQVDEALMSRYPDAVFMHDLPAHRGQEVTAAVLDGARSVAFHQAQFKLFSAMAILEWVLSSGPGSDSAPGEPAAAGAGGAGGGRP